MWPSIRIASTRSSNILRPDREKLRIGIEDPSQPEIRALLEEADTDPGVPAASPAARFHVARDDTGQAVGTGALLMHGAWAELECMWVAKSHRCKGVSRAILDVLEDCAASEKVRYLRLRTDAGSHAAIALYKRAGFSPCPPSASCPQDPHALFMQKDLQEASERQKSATD